MERDKKKGETKAEKGGGRHICMINNIFSFSEILLYKGSYGIQHIFLMHV